MLAQIRGLQVVRNHKIMLNSLLKYFGQEIYQPRDVKIGAIQDPLSIPDAIKVFLQIREMQSWATNCDRNARLWLWRLWRSMVVMASYGYQIQPRQIHQIL